MAVIRKRCCEDVYYEKKSYNYIEAYLINVEWFFLYGDRLVLICVWYRFLLRLEWMFLFLFLI